MKMSNTVQRKRSCNMMFLNVANVGNSRTKRLLWQGQHKLVTFYRPYHVAIVTLIAICGRSSWFERTIRFNNIIVFLSWNGISLLGTIMLHFGFQINIVIAEKKVWMKKLSWSLINNSFIYNIDGDFWTPCCCDWLIKTVGITGLWENFASHLRGVVLLSDASCYRNRANLRQLLAIRLVKTYLQLS